MELQVFSDPLSALAGETGLPYNQLGQMVVYDEELLKPAILLADRVVLRTWRLDMRYGQNLQGASSQLQVPLWKNIRKLVYGGHLGAAERLGVGPKLLKDLQLALDVYDADPLPKQEFFQTSAVLDFAKIWRDHYYEQWKSLRADSLAELVSAGVVLEKPWDDRDTSSLSFVAQEWVHHNQSFEYGLEQMVSELQQGSSAVLLDITIDAQLRATDLKVVEPAIETLGNAAALLRMVDGLSLASIDEIADIRRDLESHLGPFRTFMLQAAQGMNIDPEATLGERQRELVLRWETDVSPAIEDLRSRVESDKFLRETARVAGEGPDAAIGIGLGLITAFAGGLGVAALAGLGIAALPTIIKAASRTLQAKKDHRANGAYLVVELEERLRRRGILGHDE